MIQSAIKLITRALNEVDNAELVLKIKGIIALFIQTMDASFLYLLLTLSDSLQGWGYSVTALDGFLLVLFEKYAELLQRRFSDDFHEVCVLLLSLGIVLVTKLLRSCLRTITCQCQLLLAKNTRRLSMSPGLLLMRTLRKYFCLRFVQMLIIPESHVFYLSLRCILFPA